MAWRRWWCGLAVSAGLLAAGPALAAPTPVELLDRYFGAPNSPETFRALTGQGDPMIAPEYVGDSYGWVYFHDNPDAELYRRLAPGEVDASSANFESCRPTYAVATLKARIAALGKHHPYVERWVAAQKAVFQACGQRSGGGSRPPAPPLPPPLPLTDPALAKLQAQDRAYQEASRAFYQGQAEAAAAQFQKIAGSDSPHRLMGRYMVAAIHAGTSPELFGAETAPADAPKVLAELNGLLADPAMKAIHPQVQQLIGWLGYTLADAQTRRAQVNATLAALKAPAAQLAQDPAARRRYALARSDIDFLHRWDEPADWWLTGAPPAEFTASLAMQENARSDPFSAWLLFPKSYLWGPSWAAFEGTEPVGWPALKTYAAEHAEGGDPAAFAWRRAARAVGVDYEPEVWAEVDAETADAAKGDARQAAALSFDLYHQVRMALACCAWADKDRQAAFEAAAAELAGFPMKGSRLFQTARRDGLRYLMTVGRLKEARRWRDRLYAPDTAFEHWQGDNHLLLILAEDEDHFARALAIPDSYLQLPIVNNLSTAALQRLAARADVPKPMRAKFARIAWGRTYALGRTVSGDLDRTMRELNPTMVATWSSPAGRAVKPSDRRVLLDVLRSPAVNILMVDLDRDFEPRGDDDSMPGLTRLDLYNHDDDNWWCRWKVGRHEHDTEAMLREVFFGETNLSLVNGEAAYGLRERLRPALRGSWAFKSVDAAEIAALAQVPCAPKVLSERTIDWVEHPGWFGRRDGQAEALALAVRTTRYGCYSDGPHGAYSRKAWTLLHQRFGETEWAKKTKYWFNCPLGGKDCPAAEDE